MRDKSGSRRSSIVIGIASVCVLLIFAGSAYSDEAAAVKHFGVSRSEPINKSFLFIGGEYIDPPYVVERRGLAVYINDILVKHGREWPVFDWTVGEDPGEPPTDLPPSKVPEGVDLRDGYWARKWRYLVGHFEFETAVQKMIETYRKSPFVQSVSPGGRGAGGCVITFKNGRTSNVGLGIGNWQRPSDEELIAESEKKKTRWEQNLDWGRCYFLSGNGGYMAPTRKLAVTMLEILASDDDADAKLARLKEARASKGADGFLGNMLEQFEATPEFRERLNHFKYHYEVIDGAGKGPKKMPEFGDWSRWVEFAGRAEIVLTIEPKTFIDLDSGRVLGLPSELNLENKIALETWARQTGVDICAVVEGDRRGLQFFDVTNTSTNQSKKVSAYEQKIKIERAVNRADSRDEQYRRKRRFNVALYHEDRLPRIFNFKTSRGGTGRFEFEEFTDEPKGIKIILQRVIDGSQSGLAAPLGLVSASPTEDGGTFEWRVRRKEPVKVIQEWYWFDEQGVREHGGGGREIAETGTMDLSVQVSLEQDELLLKRGYSRSTDTGELTAEILCKIYRPRGTGLKGSYLIRPVWLTERLQPLWKGELIENNRTVRTVIFAARVLPEAELTETFVQLNSAEAVQIGRNWMGASDK